MAKRQNHLFYVHVTNQATGLGCQHEVRALDHQDAVQKVRGRWPGRAVDVDEACTCEDIGGCPD